MCGSDRAACEISSDSHEEGPSHQKGSEAAGELAAADGNASLDTEHREYPSSNLNEANLEDGSSPHEPVEPPASEDQPRRGYSGRRVIREIQVQDDNLLSPKMVSPEKTPQTSKSHIEVWDTCNETLIIFDWDDTLLPTTYIWNDPQLKWNEMAPCFMQPETPTMSQASADESSMLELFNRHQNAVIALLRLAVTLGQVVIVTLAEAGWVTTSCRNFMPRVGSLLEELGIEVVYAREALPSRYVKQAHQEEMDVTKVLKTRAISQTIKNFYGTGQSGGGRSWKNVISIGDSQAERLALQDVIIRHVQLDSRGALKECRCKVVQLLPEPSLERLTAEAQVLLSWLLTIVCQDDDVDIDFSEMVEGDSPPLRKRRPNSFCDADNTERADPIDNTDSGAR